ncbi:CdaR family protein [Companilactobacillus baiquanensis]|uniref:YbbR-like domain-containing protein n=1 Tax=Companilactobacillus baiquanensis TaxID=2486005 RepID=A0ABW1UWA1_9LACO|nr:CdaR family protein [Companilactobacillus baiquanensis]
MKKIINSNYFYAFISLCCAIWLFVAVSSPGVGSTRDSNQSSTSTANTKATMTVPLQVQANTNDYYITGYPESVKITLEGPSALITATKNTQNFNVYLDLKGYETGQHRVQVKVSGLNNELTYTVKPKYVTVNIQKRKTKTFTVNAEFNKSFLAEGYQAGTASISPNTVTATGAASEVKKIDRVIVEAVLPKGIKSTFDQEVLVQALDKNGKTLSVTLDPQTVHVKIPISIPSKTVSINLKGKNTSSNNSYTFDSGTKSIKIYGSQSQLDDIGDSIDIPIDVSDVNSDTKKTINLADALGSKVSSTDPDTIDVQISVKSTSSSNSSNNTSTSTTNTDTSSTNSNDSSTTNNNNDGN